MAEAKGNTKTVDLGVPTWAKILPLLGLGSGLYLAFKSKSNVGKYLVYGSIGMWATSIPLVHYGTKAFSGMVGDGINNAIQPKKEAVPPTPSTPSIPANEEDTIEAQ